MEKPRFRKLKNRELDRLSNDEFKAADKIPITIVLDNIRSLNNVGSVFRTADAFRIQKVYLCGITAQPPHKDIQKTALGATESMDWEYAKNTIDIIEKLKAEGTTILSIEQTEDSVSLDRLKLDPTTSYALVFGHEVKGVSQEVVSASDLVVEIPQFGTKHSLNIAVSVGVVLWELYTKIGSKP